jgi:diamine N-acetyltransferase
MIIFRKISSNNVLEICSLSQTLNENHRKMVADNALSIAQGFCSDSAWMKGIYDYNESTEDLIPIGFIMTHTGSDFDDMLDVDGVYLWRFMISSDYQSKGYGQAALNKLIRLLKNTGVKQLHTSVELGEGSPMGFYKKMGFIEDGQMYGDEVGLTLEL